MTIAMSEKHQVTIPSQIARVLNLKRGSLFDVALNGSRIELIPLEVKEKKLTRAEYRKLDQLLAQEKETRERVTPAFIDKIRHGKS